MNPQMAAACALRMVVGYEGVSLLVKNGDQTMALKSWHIAGTEPDFQAVESELRMIFGSERLLDLPFGSKICAMASPATTLVPRRLFNPDHLEQYFKLLLRTGGERSYGFELLESIDCYLVWAAESGLFHLCKQYFPSEKIGHIAAPLLTAFRSLAPEQGYAVFANLRGHKVQIAVFERQNLAFYNAFDFTKPSDLLYYVLLAYKQFELNPLEIPLSLSGTLLEDSEIFKLLMRYVRPMRFPPLPLGLQLPAQAKSLPAHFWFDLAVV